MKILALSGSLREKSYNSAIINTLKEMNENIVIYKDLGKLPFFNPDIDIHTLHVDNSPPIIQELREHIATSEAIIISTPEYAFEISGVLKNMLDWLVSSAQTINKPIAVISASTSAMGGDKANASLCALVQVLTGNKEDVLNLKVARVNKKFDDKGLLIDSVLKDELTHLLNRLLS